MSSLTRVETRRLTARRLIRFLALLLLLVIGMVLYGLHDQARWVSVNAPNMQAQYEDALRDWELNAEQYLQECYDGEAEEREATGDPSISWDCESWRPSEADYRTSINTDEEFRLMLTGAAVPLFLVALLVGATSTAAEFVHRTIGTLLTFEPRRGRVYLSKILAPALVALPVAALYCGLLLGGAAAVLRVHGIDDGLSGSDWTVLAWQAGRVIMLAAAIAAVGAAAGFLLRNTAGVLGVLLAYLVGVEGILAAMLAPVQRWLVSRHVEAWLNDGDRWSSMDCGPTGCVERTLYISLEQALLYLVLLCAVAVAISWWRFRRADID